MSFFTSFWLRLTAVIHRFWIFGLEIPLGLFPESRAVSRRHSQILRLYVDDCSFECFAFEKKSFVVSMLQAWLHGEQTYKRTRLYLAPSTIVLFLLLLPWNVDISFGIFKHVCELAVVSTLVGCWRSQFYSSWTIQWQSSRASSIWSLASAADQR